MTRESLVTGLLVLGVGAGPAGLALGLALVVPSGIGPGRPLSTPGGACARRAAQPPPR